MPTTRRSHSPARGRALKVLAAVLFLLFFVPGDGATHDLGFTRVLVVILPDDTFRIDMWADLDALALGRPQDTDDAQLMALLDQMSAEELDETVEGLRRTLLRRMRLRFDGETFLPEVSFPDRETDRARANRTVIGLSARLDGEVPEGATEISLQASRAFPPLHVTYVDLRGRALDAAAANDLLQLPAPAPMPTGDDSAADADSALAEALGGRLGDLVTRRDILERGDRSPPYPLDHPPPAPRRIDVAADYLGLGFRHILPLGTDHILFVLGLFLLNTAWRPLLAQVTAFTVAHTLTLALSMYGVVSLSPHIVEPLIAISIAWIAFENVVTDELKPWRPSVVFGFGLLHGLGFAGVLSELGLPPGEYLTALLSFNAGVELGQLAVLALAFLALGWFRQWPGYRDRIAVPLSVAIGVVGIYWAFERLLAA